MRILYWTDLYFPHVGGIEVFSAKLIPALQRRGHTVELVTSHRGFDQPDYAEENGIKIHRLHFWNALENRDIRQLVSARKRIAQIKKNFRPDVVHLHYGATSYFHLNSLAAHPSATLITIHSLPPASLKSGSLLHRLLPVAGHINTVSRHALARLHRYCPEVRSHSSCVYYGLESPQIQQKSPVFRPAQLLCLGRLVPQKGFDVALRAFSMVHQRFPNSRLVIAGEGAERDALEEQSCSLSIHQAVVFKGLVPPDEVYGLLNESSVVLIPSRHEGLPLVALQAAQMARPIISTDADGLPELIAHKETGLLVEKEDHRGLAEAVEWMLTHCDRAIELGSGAQARFQESFSIESCTREYEMLYEKAVDYWQSTDLSLKLQGESEQNDVLRSI